MAPRTRAERQAELRDAPKITPKGTEGFFQTREPVVTDYGREPTAVEQLAALKAREFAGNGLLIPPPSPMTLQSAHEWLQQIAEIGSGGHVELAWLRIPGGPIKDKLVNEYVRLANEAGRRHAVLEERAMAEEAAERAAHQERMKTVTKQREKASLMARLAALEAQG
jgi:hypothetical protein